MPRLTTAAGVAPNAASLGGAKPGNRIQSQIEAIGGELISLNSLSAVLSIANNKETGAECDDVPHRERLRLPPPVTRCMAMSGRFRPQDFEVQ
jgi:hypothetical protein